MKSLKKLINQIIARVFFIGEMPGAPGTWGSAAAVIFIYIFSGLNNLIFISILFFVGVISSKYEELDSKINDNPKIVIDEFLGVFVTFIFLDIEWWILILGFILFRIFDIYKVSLIKKSQKLPGGWGVMMDDLLAGVVANFILRAVIYVL